MRKATRAITQHIRLAITLTLLGAFFCLYLKTLAPDVLAGDSGEFQYLTHVLGLPHEYGFPLYMVLGYLWSWIPIGSVAYRLNLLSVVCAILALASLSKLIYAITASIGAVVVAVAAFGLSVAFWSYSVVAERYALNLSLFVWLVYCAWMWQKERRERWLLGVAVFSGLAAAVHNTIILAIPTVIVWILLDKRFYGWLTPMRMARLAASAFLPLLFFLYVPFRGLTLFNPDDTLTGLSMPLSVAQGLVTPLFTGNSLDQWLGYISSHSTLLALLLNVGQGVAAYSVYVGLLLDNFHWTILLLAVVGILRGLSINWRFWGGGLVYIFVNPVLSLTYGGRVPAYVMPTYVLIAIGIGLGCTFVSQNLLRIIHRQRTSRIIECFLYMGVSAVLVLTLLLNYPRADQSHSTGVADYWQEILDYPLDTGTALAAHQGDLMPFWYYQQIDHKRPDLLGLFPPSEDVLENWIIAHRHFYLAGALHNWSPELAKAYNITVFGKLVYVSAMGDVPACPIATGSPSLTAGNRTTLEAVQVSPSYADNYVQIAMCWDVIAPVAEDTMISLRIADLSGIRVLQKDELVVSSWYPANSVEPGNRIINFFRLRVPAGLTTGSYTVSAVLYSRKSRQEWITPLGTAELPLGQFAWTP